jgi:hypothetical protein
MANVNTTGRDGLAMWVHTAGKPEQPGPLAAVDEDPAEET